MFYYPPPPHQSSRSAPGLTFIPPCWWNLFILSLVSTFAQLQYLVAPPFRFSHHFLSVIGSDFTSNDSQLLFNGRHLSVMSLAFRFLLVIDFSWLTMFWFHTTFPFCYYLSVIIFLECIIYGNGQRAMPTEVKSHKENKKGETEEEIGGGNWVGEWWSFWKNIILSMDTVQGEMRLTDMNFIFREIEN